MIPEPPHFELRKWMASDPLRRFDTFLLYVRNLEDPPKSSERAVADRLTDIEKRLDQLEKGAIDDAARETAGSWPHDYQEEAEALGRQVRDLAEANRALARESDQEHDRAEKATHLTEQHQTKLEQLGADLIDANQRRDEAYARISQLERDRDTWRRKYGNSEAHIRILEHDKAFLREQRDNLHRQIAAMTGQVAKAVRDEMDQ